MANYKQMEEYYQKLKSAFDSKKVFDYYNQDRAHNATVFRLMLDESENIFMYCGELSLLRIPFYDLVVGGDKDKNNTEPIMTSMYESLSKFFKKSNSHICVILENKQDIDNFKDTNLVRSALDNKQLEIYYLGNDLTTRNDLNHFTVTDSEIVRVEQDKEQHSAICTLNDEEYYLQFNKYFQQILSYSKPLNIKL